MPTLTLPQAFDLALQHHRAGRLTEAESLYRQILAVQPNHAEALQFLGVIAHQVSRPDLAIEWIGRALTIDPRNPQAYSNLGEALSAAGRKEEAIAAYRQSLAIDPHEALVHYNLGNVLRDTGQLDEAIVAFRRAVELQPRYAEALNNLAGVFSRQRRTHEAIASHEEATRLQPDYAEAWNNLGTALRDGGRRDEAIAAYRRALALKPRYAEAYNNLGIVLWDQGRFDEAIAAYREAAQLEPAIADVHYNLGTLLNFLGRLDESVAATRRVLELRPRDAEAYNLIGEALRNQGRVAEAIDALRQAAKFEPVNPAPHSNLIYTLNFLEADAEPALAAEQTRWNQRFSIPLRATIQPHRNDRTPGRRLRVGYVSPDLRDHVVGRNLLPLLTHHDPAQFEIWCYSGSRLSDNITEIFRGCASSWCITADLSDEALAAMIHEHGIDILVDLTQHMGGNRLPAFARRPAPVQVSFAGYPESTGLEAIGYRLSDRWLEGQGASMADGQRQIAESPGETGLQGERVFLLESFWCYDPIGLEVPVNALPARTNGLVTFGSMNNFCKVNDPLLRLWARVLGAVPDSRLLLLSRRGSHRQQALDFLEREGVAPGRVEFADTGPRRGYLELYHRVDIVLDTFPYNGHTTSLDALWMGVPVVSLCGDRAVSRAGLSQSSNLGLPELVAFTEEQYVDITIRLAHDLPRLRKLRATLRPRMEQSVLMDAPRFARQIEVAYRAMWQQWCGQEGP